MSVLRIKAGMSHEEVDAVIGLPSDLTGMHPCGRWTVRHWRGLTGTITVRFDDDRVTERHFSPSSPSMFDRFYCWIGIDD